MKWVRRIALGLIGLLVVAFVGLAIWGYAPDRDPAELRAEYARPPSKFITLDNGQQVHVRDTGPRDAPVLLLLHGSSASLHTWEGWADALQDRYRVIRYDQPGHGLTGPQVDNDYSASGFAGTAAMVMDELGVDKYVVAGNSMGGWVAWNHALAFPDRVRGVILVDSSGAPDAAPSKLPIGFRLAQSPLMQPVMRVFTPRSIIRSSLETTVGDPDSVTDEQVDLYWNMLRYPGNREATRRRGEVRRDQATPEEVGRIHVPVLILWGARDTLIPVKAANWFKQALPDSKLIVYSDLGHIPMEEDPARTARDVRQWLAAEKLDRKPPAETGTAG